MDDVTESLPPVQRGHLASLQTGLDFVNTLHFTGSHRHGEREASQGPTHDHLESARSALDWLVDHDLLHASARDGLVARYQAVPQEGEEVLARLRRIRTAMHGLLETGIRGRPANLADLAEINRAMRTHYVYELVPAEDGISLEHRHQGDPVDGAMARLAECVARELLQGSPHRLRICENATCQWVFKDLSPTGRKKWCDMATCGNRAKVARHRARQRAGVRYIPAVARSLEA